MRRELKSERRLREAGRPERSEGRPAERNRSEPGSRGRQPPRGGAGE